MKKYVAVRARYYKSDNGVSVIKHGDRLITGSKNIVDKYTKYNFYGQDRPISEVYDEVRSRHRQAQDRAIRKDFNAVFEHVIVFSDDQVRKLIKDTGFSSFKDSMSEGMKAYISDVHDVQGFEPLGWAFHCDEGHVNSKGKFVRNWHCHAYFYNYDFAKRSAPLQGLFKKGKDLKTGKTNQLNHNFVFLQNCAFYAFSDLNFERGVSSASEGKKHLEKEDFIKTKIESYSSILEGLKSQSVKQVKKLALKLEMYISAKINNERKEADKIKSEIDSAVEVLKPDDLRDVVSDVVDSVDQELSEEKSRRSFYDDFDYADTTYYETYKAAQKRKASVVK